VYAGVGAFSKALPLFKTLEINGWSSADGFVTDADEGVLVRPEEERIAITIP
jgi:hypothetical protein